MGIQQVCELTEGQSHNVLQERSYKAENTRSNDDRLGRQLQWCDKREAARKGKVAACVYLIQAGEFTKIGVASDVDRRVATMQTGCPYELSVLHAWLSPNPYRLERRLHFIMRRYRYRGEWFKIPERELQLAINDPTLAEM